MPYVFEGFRQAYDVGSTHEGGLRLGMAITRNILELHGGAIWAESPAENLGATFTVRLLVTFVGRNENAAGEELWVGTTDPANAALNLDGLPVLVVDDDAEGAR